MASPGDDAREPVPGADRSLVLLRLALLTALVLATAAVAGPRRPAAVGARLAAEAACAGEELLLPPGHPPIPGLGAWQRGSGLPPGHPPVDGPAQRMARPLRPLAPSFEAPATIDI
jgi:hypothetical protein